MEVAVSLSGEISGGTPTRSGRQPSTTHAEIGRIALDLFVKNGFDATTVDEVAAAAGIARRTLFRYYPSKNDLPWGEFDDLLDEMRSFLHAVPPDVPLGDALHDAVVAFNTIPPDQLELHRLRMQLLLRVPALVAHSNLRYAAWRSVVAEFVARRLGLATSDLEPQAMAWALLGVSIAAYESWIEDDGADLVLLLDSAYRMLGRSLARRG